MYPLAFASLRKSKPERWWRYIALLRDLGAYSYSSYRCGVILVENFVMVLFGMNEALTFLSKIDPRWTSRHRILIVTNSLPATFESIKHAIQGVPDVLSRRAARALDAVGAWLTDSCGGSVGARVARYYVRTLHKAPRGAVIMRALMNWGKTSADDPAAFLALAEPAQLHHALLLLAKAAACRPPSREEALAGVRLLLASGRAASGLDPHTLVQIATTCAHDCALTEALATHLDEDAALSLFRHCINGRRGALYGGAATVRTLLERSTWRASLVSKLRSHVRDHWRRARAAPGLLKVAVSIAGLDEIRRSCPCPRLEPPWVLALLGLDADPPLFIDMSRA